MSEKLAPSDERLPGKLNQEQFDALKMEVSALSPAEDVELRTEAESANTTFQQLYGKYCRPQPEGEELSKRVIMTDKAHAGRFMQAWFPEVSEFISYTNSSDMTAYGDRQGELIIGTPIDIWPLVPQDTKEEWIARDGSEENAEKIINEVVQYNLLAHELSHLYQDASLPLPFQECGAYYYGREIAEHDRGSFRNKPMDARANFYKDLLYIYGEDVHRLFFGTLKDVDKTQRILNMFVPNVVRELFPEMPEEKN